jgi:hypothetical protein
MGYEEVGWSLKLLMRSYYPIDVATAKVGLHIIQRNDAKKY